jgi:hypothetical protein
MVIALACEFLTKIKKSVAVFRRDCITTIDNLQLLGKKILESVDDDLIE